MINEGYPINFSDAFKAQRLALTQAAGAAAPAPTAEAWAEARLNAFLADAFGTYFMGPAYAFAAIYQWFDPAAPTAERTEHAADHERAFVMFGILKKLETDAKRRKAEDDSRRGLAPGAKPSLDEEAFSRVVNMLREIWQNMVSRVDIGAGGYSEATWTTGKMALLNEIVDSIWERYYEHFWRLCYTRSEHDTGWATAKDWSDRWISAIGQRGNDSLPGVRIPHSSNGAGRDTLNSAIRDALNAGWICRLERPNDTARISAAVRQLCREIVKRQRSMK